jgi:thiol-disulfide isomerase/thioredoxin
MNTIIIIGAIFIFITVGYFLYNTFYKVKSTNFIENNEYKPSSNMPDSNLLLFYTSWCPHCKTTMDLWNKIKLQNKYPNLTFVEVDCETNIATAESYNITEYPTIILVKNNKKYIYDANLSETTLDIFINTVTNK